MLGNEILPIHDMYKGRLFACIINLLYTNITFKEIDLLLPSTGVSVAARSI